MELSNILLIIQLVATVLFAIITWSLKMVISSNMEPIKNDINGMRTDIHEIKNFWKEHKADIHPHPNYEDIVEEIFVKKEQLEDKLRVLEDRIEWRARNGH